MLEVFVDQDNESSVVAYLDGRDARLFKEIQARLGSEEKVHNAFILLGLLKKLVDLDTINSSQEAEMTKSIFPEYVGVSFEEFENLLQSCSSIT